MSVNAISSRKTVMVDGVVEYRITCVRAGRNQPMKENIYSPSCCPARHSSVVTGLFGQVAVVPAARAAGSTLTRTQAMTQWRTSAAGNHEGDKYSLSSAGSFSCAYE